jgi:26S proteasome regulatory subunit N7
MGEPQFVKFPDLSLAQHIFQITNPHASSRSRQASLTALKDAIEEKRMAPLYRYLAHPTEGVLNASGEGSAEAHKLTLRRTSSSATQMLATRRPSWDAGISLSWDDVLFEELQEENEEELKKIQQEEDEAVEKAGETEIQTARGKRAEYYTKIGDKVGKVHHLLSDRAITNERV